MLEGGHLRVRARQLRRDLAPRKQRSLRGG
jgi:hypothetical protein